MLLALLGIGLIDTPAHAGGWNRGDASRALYQTHCSGCHSPRGLGDICGGRDRGWADTDYGIALERRGTVFLILGFPESVQEQA